MPLFFLEGNIGVGKTTLLSKLEHLPNVRVVYEPVDEWMNMRATADSPSVFELYYSDKQKYGFMFQMVALQTRIKHIMNILATAKEGEIIVCERSYLTDKNIFAKMLLNETEYMVYDQWYTYLIDLIKPKVDGIIYLRVNPRICMERIKKRNRPGETIDTAYLTKLHIQHDYWLLEEKTDVCIMIINGDDENLEVTPALCNFISYNRELM